MACDHNWTIKFTDVNDSLPFEIRPIEMSLKMSRTKYDFCRAKVSWEVGEEMKPHTRYRGGELYGLNKVNVCYNDIPIQPLMFRPDWVDYGNEFTYLQFHDLHKSLDSGVIDEQREVVHLKDIYETVFKSAPDRLINDIDFTFPNRQVRTLYGDINTAGRGSYRKRKARKEETKRVLESDYAIDFNKISPQKALRRLNKKFRLKSWVNRNETLVIGLPEAKEVRHIAAADDSRVWRYKDPNISHGREPIKSVIVEGAWKDEPGVDGDIISWFNEGGTADVKAMGLAERTDIDYGNRFMVKSTKAKSDAVPHVAKLALKERMKQQNSGTVEIDPELSGTDQTNPVDLHPGDLLHLVPEDKYFYNPRADSGEIGDSPSDPDKVCGNYVNNEVYLVREVEHNLTDQGQWQIFADLGMYPDVEIRSYMSYFNPESDEWVKGSEIDSDGELEDDGFFSFESI